MAFNPEDLASRGLHFRRMTRVLRLWITEERMLLADLEYVLDVAGKRLFYSRESLKKLPVPTESPTALLPLTRPADPAEDDMPSKLEFHADWLAASSGLPVACHGRRHFRTDCCARLLCGLDPANIRFVYWSHMSETRDKRRRTDLDLFVLALIESGISTPYEFQKSAGLSPGATIPALQRLLESGFVRQGKPGVRGRTDHHISPAGKQFLKSGWRLLIEDGPSGDLDADLRVALLALWVGGQRSLAVDFLRQSANQRRELIETSERSVSDSASVLADWYTRLRSLSAKALLQAESDAAFALAEALPRKLSTKPRRLKRPAKPQK